MPPAGSYISDHRMGTDEAGRILGPVWNSSTPASALVGILFIVTLAPLVVAGDFESTTTLTSSLNPSTSGQTVTFTATVTGEFEATPVGTVTFQEGAVTLGTGNLDGDGKATFATSTLTVGTHTITATYAGDAAFDVSTSSPLSQVVNAASGGNPPAVSSGTPTTTALSLSPSPSVLSQPVQLTATVSGGTPTGTVTFLDGGSVLGRGTLDGSRMAILKTSALTVGRHSLTARYDGDPTHASSTSSPGTQDVVVAKVVAVSSSNPAESGTPVTFTVTVTAADGAVPSGRATLLDGTTALETKDLDPQGSGVVATFTTSALSVGTHTITAEYRGDPAEPATTSSAVSQVIVAGDAGPRVYTTCLSLDGAETCTSLDERAVGDLGGMERSDGPMNSVWDEDALDLVDLVANDPENPCTACVGSAIVKVRRTIADPDAQGPHLVSFTPSDPAASTARLRGNLELFLIRAIMSGYPDAELHVKFPDGTTAGTVTTVGDVNGDGKLDPATEAVERPFDPTSQSGSRETESGRLCPPTCPDGQPPTDDAALTSSTSPRPSILTILLSGLGGVIVGAAVVTAVTKRKGGTHGGPPPKEGGWESRAAGINVTPVNDAPSRSGSRPGGQHDPRDGGASGAPGRKHGGDPTGGPDAHPTAPGSRMRANEAVASGGLQPDGISDQAAGGGLTSYARAPPPDVSDLVNPPATPFKQLDQFREPTRGRLLGQLDSFREPERTRAHAILTGIGPSDFGGPRAAPPPPPPPVGPPGLATGEIAGTALVEGKPLPNATVRPPNAGGTSDQAKISGSSGAHRTPQGFEPPEPKESVSREGAGHKHDSKIDADIKAQDHKLDIKNKRRDKR